MQLAVQLDMLPGADVSARFEAARQLNLRGVEVWSRDAIHDPAAIATAARDHDIQVAAVHHGAHSGILDPHPIDREAALEQLRAALVAAVDVGAGGVVLVPHWRALNLPDLSPFMSPQQIAADLLYFHLRTLSDYAYAMGTKLFLQPVNHYETGFISRIEPMTQITRKLNHPDVTVAVDLYHATLEEPHLQQTLRDHADQITHIHLADTNRGLPGHGMMDVAAVAEALRAMQYDGWVVLACGTPGRNHDNAAYFAEHLPACLDRLRGHGFV